jgi:hypothetical protein
MRYWTVYISVAAERGCALFDVLHDVVMHSRRDGTIMTFVSTNAYILLLHIALCLQCTHTTDSVDAGAVDTLVGFGFTEKQVIQHMFILLTLIEDIVTNLCQF